MRAEQLQTIGGEVREVEARFAEGATETEAENESEVEGESKEQINRSHRAVWRVANNSQVMSLTVS